MCSLHYAAKPTQKLIAGLPTPPGIIKDVIASSETAASQNFSGGVVCGRDSKSVVHCILKLLFASDIPLRCLHRSVAKQKLNLFQLTSTSVAQADVRVIAATNRDLPSAEMKIRTFMVSLLYQDAGAKIFRLRNSLRNFPF